MESYLRCVDCSSRMPPQRRGKYVLRVHNNVKPEGKVFLCNRKNQILNIVVQYSSQNQESMK